MKYNFLDKGDQTDVGSAKLHKEYIENLFKLKWYEDSISLWISEMDFRMAPEIEEAIINRTKKGILGYTGLTSKYYESVIDWFQYKYNAKIKKEWIVPSTGTVPSIRSAIRAFTLPNERVIIQPPVYGQFASTIRETKRTIAKNPLIKTEHGYIIDFEGFEALAKQDDVTMFILCNPHNPTGTLWSKEDLTTLLEICEKNNVLVYSDEVHAEIIRKNKNFVSVSSLDFDNVIVANALSKAFNLTGLHITNLVIPNQQLKEQYTAYTGFSSISPLAYEAVIAAYTKAKNWLTEVNEVIDSNLMYTKEFLERELPNVKFIHPDATYLAWLDFSYYGVKTQKLMYKLSENKLILESGLLFGAEGKHHARMMTATPLDRLIQALDILKQTLNELEKM